MQRQHFADGDLALLVDRRGRRYMLTLSSEKSFHTHMGVVPHADIIGQEAGCRVKTSSGHILLAFRPTLGDYILEMPHPSQVVYPKDLGAIIMHGDIFPGARVLEAGVGSGALTLALLRAVGNEGSVVSYEVRQDMVDKARTNINALIPNPHNFDIKVKDVYLDIDEPELDRIVLDVPEPWHVVPEAARVLAPGGIFLSYLPTVLQIHELQAALVDSPNFELMETVEILERPWSVSHRSVRPVHRMVAHTGFITTARKCTAKETPEAEEDANEID
jgi:tRNA (adenine57-N1/adenine58-N1)-methyltransferase